MLVVFLVLLTLALPVLLYGTYYVARGIVYGLRTVNWRETSGVILFSNVAQLYRGKEVAKEILQLSYVYTVDGVDYEGKRVTFKSFTWFFGDLNKLAAQYPKGQEVAVYYDPLHPEEAVLEKGTARADAFLLAGLALLCGGILWIWIPLPWVLALLAIALMVFLVCVFRELRHNRGVNVVVS